MNRLDGSTATPAAPMLLSLCMIVRNEKALLQRCLASVKGLPDEIIVVDTGSTDGTQEAALGFGATVIEEPWRNDFAQARNIGLARARAPWILVLDADEVLEEPAKKALRKLAREHLTPDGRARCAFHLLQNNSSDGGRTGMLVPIARLFPNRPEIRYEWPVHEQVEECLQRHGIQILDTEVRFLHDGYADPQRNLAKQRRNLEILRGQIEAGLARPLTWFLLGGAHLDLGDFEPALAAYRACVEAAGPADSLGLSARVRVVGCLQRLGRPEEALHEAAALASRPHHPEALLAEGQCLAMLGRDQAAGETWKQVLHTADGAFMPPCNLNLVKLETVLAAANLLKSRGRENEAVALMRGVLDLRRQGRPVPAQWLDRVFAAASTP